MQACVVSTSRLRSTIVQNEKHFTSKQTTWCRRLLMFMKNHGFYQQSYLPIEIYMDYLRSLRLVAHKSEVYHVSYLFELSGCSINQFQLRSWSFQNPREHVDFTIPSRSAITSAIRTGSLLDGLVIILKYCSGRRHCDILRLKSKNVHVKNNRVHIRLSYTKTTRTITAYSFEFKTDLNIDLEPYQRLFARMLVRNSQPFQNYDFDSLRRQVPFQLKSLRSARAIHYILDGHSEESVMNRIGWSCSSTFRLYVRLPITSIQDLRTYDAVVDVLNSHN
jgi:integrase